MRNRYMWLGLLFLVLVIGIGAWRLSANKEANRAEFLMSTYMEIRAIGRKAPQALDAVFARLVEIEDRMTKNSEDSEIAAINQYAGQEAVAVSDDTFAVIGKALQYAELTRGKFDPTIQPIVELWQIGTPQARVPSNAEIAAQLPLVNYQAVETNASTRTVRLNQAGMGLDLGGIAKGYAADEAVRILQEYGVKKALINLGGNLYALGTNPNNQPWRIGIQDPEDDRNQFIAVVEAEDQTLVTSGAYERFLERDGITYHHILDPETGYPAASDLLSVTIVTNNSIDADALSTSVYILGREAGLALIESLPDIEAVIIDRDYRVYLTAGLSDRFTVVDQRYELMP